MKTEESSMFRTESEFIGWLKGRARADDRRVRLGIGDDAALVQIGKSCELALTTDFSIEGVHFSRRIHPPRSVGHRALARALSDLAAMGAKPRYALVSLAVSKRTTRRWIKEFYAGMHWLARRFEVSIIGGDTAVVPGPVSVDAIAIGEIARGQAVQRSGAHPGDSIFVSGRLGMSALGLRQLNLQRRSRRSANLQPPQGAIRAHLYPEPRCHMGCSLAEGRLATAMIDISDGLSSDLSRLCEASEVGARIEAELIPAPQIPSMKQGLALALHGGEDYELLFAVPPFKVSQVPRRFHDAPIHRIGTISRNRGLILISEKGMEETLQPSGYDHFLNR